MLHHATDLPAVASLEDPCQFLARRCVPEEREEWLNLRTEHPSLSRVDLSGRDDAKFPRSSDRLMCVGSIYWS